MTTGIPLHALPWDRADAGPFPVWLLIFSSLLVFSPLLEGGTTHTAAMIIRLLTLLLVCAWWRDAVRRRQLAVPSLPMWPAVIAFLALAAVSVARSPYRHQSVQWLIVLLGDAAVLGVLASALATWRHVPWIIVLLTGMGVFEAGVALMQGWSEHVARPVGTFANPNFLAGYLAAIVCLLVGVLVHGKVRWGRTPAGHRRLGVAAALCAAMMLGAILWTGSRGGLLALGAGVGVTVFLRYGWNGLVATVLVVVVALVTPNPLSHRVRAEHAANPVSYARWQMWESAARQMRDYPFGIGLGLYQYLSPRYAFPIEGQVARYGKVAQTPHSEYAQIGVELGVLALAVFCVGIGQLATEIRALATCRLRRWQRGIVAGVGGATASILVHAAVDSNLHEPAVVMVLILCVAVLCSAKRLSGLAPPNRLIPIRHSLLWSAMVLVAMAFAAMLVLRLGVAWMAFEAGSRALERGQVERAIEYLSQAVALDPDKALYHRSLAAAHFQVFQQTRERARLSTVVDELKTAIVLNPLSAKPLKVLGDVSHLLAAGADRPEERRSWLEQAREAYRQAIEREPFNPAHRLELGRLLLALADQAEAEQAVRSAVAIEPNYLPGRLWLALHYVRTDRLESAQQEYEEILRRQRYHAGKTLDGYERGFLHVDVRELAASLERARGPTRNGPQV